MSAGEWDETQVPRKVSNKSIDTYFLADLLVENYRVDEYRDGWGRPHCCDRPAGHTGRHLALERLYRYPVAVWR